MCTCFLVHEKMTGQKLNLLVSICKFHVLKDMSYLQIQSPSLSPWRAEQKPELVIDRAVGRRVPTVMRLLQPLLPSRQLLCFI